jgi:phage terminase large subunit-like protein
MPDGRYIIADVNRLRAEGTGVRRMIRETAQQDGRYCEIGIPQDPGQAGKVMAEDRIAFLSEGHDDPGIRAFFGEKRRRGA